MFHKHALYTILIFSIASLALLSGTAESCGVKYYFKGTEINPPIVDGKYVLPKDTEIQVSACSYWVRTCGNTAGYWSSYTPSVSLSGKGQAYLPPLKIINETIPAGLSASDLLGYFTDRTYTDITLSTKAPGIISLADIPPITFGESDTQIMDNAMQDEKMYTQVPALETKIKDAINNATKRINSSGNYADVSVSTPTTALYEYKFVKKFVKEGDSEMLENKKMPLWNESSLGQTFVEKDGGVIAIKDISAIMSKGTYTGTLPIYLKIYDSVNGNILGTSQQAPSALPPSKGWVTFSFSPEAPVTLVPNREYYFELVPPGDSNSTNAPEAYYLNSNGYSSGDYFAVNYSDTGNKRQKDAGKDAAFNTTVITQETSYRYISYEYVFLDIYANNKISTVSYYVPRTFLTDVAWSTSSSTTYKVGLSGTYYLYR